jgi:F-type H+-transporting ATPase subunit b
MSLLTPDLGLLFWMLLSFGIVFFVLAKFGFPVIVKMVEDRKKYIDQSLESAKLANDRLQGIQKEGERILAEARVKQSVLLKEANALRSKMIKDAKEQAQVEVTRLMEEAKLSIQKEKDLALRDIHNQIAVLSIDIAEKILRKNLDNKSAQLELVDKLIGEAQKN